MFSTGRFRHVLAAAFLIATTLPAGAQTPAETALYRVFLRDGSTVVSFGEYARVADRVVLSLPIGSTQHLLSIPSDTVDWDRTEAYAESVRATKYAATSGANDLALLNEAVSRALAEIGMTPEATRKIAMATEARQNVMKWAADHFGYQAPRVAEMASLFDTVIAEARTQAGEKNVELSLVANMVVPPSVPLLPAPTLQESVEQALNAAALSPEATERTSLLRSIEATLEGAGASAAWAIPLRARASAALQVETRTTRSYEVLMQTVLHSADRHARAANVTAVERTIRLALSEDDRLGQRRPQEMASLLAMLDTKLDAARRLRLARDNWAARAEGMRQFRAAVVGPLDLLRRSRVQLDEIRRLAGPPRLELRQLVARTKAAIRLLAVTVVPAEGASVHGLLKSAAQMATRAAEGRQRAVLSGQMPSAWEAASAASGALMFLDRAVEELDQLSKVPSLQAPR